MVQYLKDFDVELEKIGKLIDTPELIRQHAIGVLTSVQAKVSDPLQKASVGHGIKILSNIGDKSIKDNYTAIFNQACVLAVSLLAATIEKYFINYGNTNWEKINTTSKGGKLTFSLSDLAEADYNFRPDIMRRIRNRDTSINFQDLQSTLRSFNEYQGREFKIAEDIKKNIIFYQQCRHNIVHVGGVVDEFFVKRTESQNANIKGYKSGKHIELNESDWENIRKYFRSFVDLITKREEEEAGDETTNR